MDQSLSLSVVDRWRYALTIAGIVVLLAIGLHLFIRQDNEWERVFISAANRLWTGQDLYCAEGAYLYPPFTAWATLPFLSLSHDVGRFVFVALNLACVVFVLRGAWHLAGAGLSNDSVDLRAVFLGGCVGIFYIHNCLVHQQTDVLIAALLIGGCLALARGRSLLAATGFGLATAMKCTALLWLPYLLWRRRFLAAAWLLVVALAVNLLPDLVSHPASGRTWLGEYVVRYLQPLTDRDHVPGSWASEIVYNQSLAGTAQRWLMTVPHWTADDCTVEKTQTTLSPLTLRKIVLGTEVLLMLLTLWCAGRPFNHAKDAEKQTLEFSVVLLLMLLLSPMSSMAHFGVLVLPGFCLARRAIERHDRVLLTLLLAASAAALMSNKDLLGGRLYTVALWGGCVMLNTLLLLIGCLYGLSRKQNISSVTPETLQLAA